MSELINTKKRTNQYSGNYSSTEYNSRVEENYQDLVYLYNKYNVLDKKIDETFNRVATDHVFMSRYIKDILERIKAIEAQEKMMSIHSYSQIDNARFASNEDYAISSGEQLSFNSIYNYLTLPEITGSSVSLLKTYNSLNDQVIPDYINLKVVPLNSADGAGALIDTTPPYYCLYDRHDRVWRRSVVVDEPVINGALMYFYIKIPQNSINQKINTLMLSPYPSNSVDIISIEYTQNPNPILSDGDSWKPINEKSLYNNDPSAVGYVAPGGWVRSTVSDAILSSGPLYFNFNVAQTDTKPVTALRIAMRQRNYIKENGKYIYTYGLSDLDVRVNKHMPTGKAFIKYMAPEDTLIFTVDSVTPKIYNVPLSLIDNIFTYRVIYPTSSGGYSLSPQGGSSNVWIEVSLSKTETGDVPIISDLIVNYS
jgi:hypothetical protein